MRFSGIFLSVKVCPHRLYKVCLLYTSGFSAVLARILLPEDYGVIGVMTVFTTFFSVLANMGIGTAVIQNKELSDYDVSNIFTFNLYVAVGLSIIFAIFSVPLSKFYGNSVYIPIGCLLSVSLFFSTMNMAVSYTHLDVYKRQVLCLYYGVRFTMRSKQKAF